MSAKLSTKGRVTIPKQIRNALGLKPGMPVHFSLNQKGELVIHSAEASCKRKPDRFEAARGKADIKWRTKDLIALLRSDV